MKAPQTKQPHGNNENAGVTMIIPRLLPGASAPSNAI